jgi:hypothetical protein
VYRSDSFVWKCTTLCTGQITLCMEVYYIVYRSDSVVWKCTTLCTGQTTLCMEVYYIVYKSDNTTIYTVFWPVHNVVHFHIYSCLTCTLPYIKLFDLYIMTTLCVEVYYIVYRLDNCIYGSVLHCVQVSQLYVWKCATLCTGQTTVCMEVYYI